MHLITLETVKRIQEDRTRRSLSSYRARERAPSDIRVVSRDLEAVVIELDFADPTEATHPIGA